ncbi:MAG: biopolymer transporter ExbD [Bacteroidales bacterium]|jgi:biopolymer transport protein ExbD|nr:biopolymer transporter ExbD [Bacteroidales bacterium]
MALKRQNKVTVAFSMASMTDVIFLLLIFFMITATIVMPNTIKLSLPESKREASQRPSARVIIDEELNYFVAYGNEKERPSPLEEITPFLEACRQKNPDGFVALYADGEIPYKEIVRILDLAARNQVKMVIATHPVD